MKLLVCGGRDFIDVEYAIPLIHKIHLKTPVTALICGMAKGADSIGLAWARELGIPVEEYHADWKKHGKAAGPIRNQQMLMHGAPDLVLALPGGTGTAGMVDIARKASTPTVVYRATYFTRQDPVWGFLSNFYPNAFYGPGTEEVKSYPVSILYKSNEHYYQSEKTLDPEWKQRILDAEDPGAAKKIGNQKSLPMREDWATYKLVAMMDGLRLKFTGHPQDDMTTRLLHTGDDYLVEYAPWGDTFWGVDKDKKGQNWLGRLLMRRRTEIMTGRLYE